MLQAGRRLLTGARIETADDSHRLRSAFTVASSRGRGSKLATSALTLSIPPPPPHGGADRNLHRQKGRISLTGRLLTGARIETGRWTRQSGLQSPPRGRGS